MTPEEHYKEVVKSDMDKFNKKAPKFDYYDLLDFADSYYKKQLTLTDVVSSKRDETLELLEEIMVKVKDADSEVENGIYDPMLECAKHILNNYKIERR
jgi:hypothetical protein